MPIEIAEPRKETEKPRTAKKTNLSGIFFRSLVRMQKLCLVSLLGKTSHVHRSSTSSSLVQLHTCICHRLYMHALLQGPRARMIAVPLWFESLTVSQFCTPSRGLLSIPESRLSELSCMLLVSLTWRVFLFISFPRHFVQSCLAVWGLALNGDREKIVALLFILKQMPSAVLT